MARKKTKTQRPLTISIHGQNLDIEAKFGDSHLADVLAEVIKRLTGSPATAATAPTAAIAVDQAPLAMLIDEFGKLLRTEQIELMTNSLDMKQKILFMEILHMAKTAHTGAS